MIDAGQTAPPAVRRGKVAGPSAGESIVYQAKDVMNEALVTVAPDATIEQAIQILLAHKISGIISEYQLLEVIYAPEIKARPVRDMMTKDVLTVQENTNLADIASLFILHRIRRIPVLRGTELVGMISRRDILRYATEAADDLDAFISEARSFAQQ
jgi:CBS domain-containing protein